METVVVGSLTPSVLLEVARATGALRAQDLSVLVQAVASSPSQFQSPADGDIDLALTSPDNVLAYRASSANPLGKVLDARIVSAVDRSLGLGLYAVRGVTASHLRGATLGVDVPDSGFALLLYALCESLGLGRNDYRLVSLAATPQRLTALLSGQCHATMLNAGNELKAEAAGCGRLSGVAEIGGPYLGTVIAAVGDTRPATGRRLAASLAQTATVIVDGGLTDEAEGAAQRQLGLDPELAQLYVERLRDPVDGLVGDGTVDRDSLATLVRLRTTYLPVPDGNGHLWGAMLREGSGLV